MTDLPRLLHVGVTLAPAMHERVRAIPLDANRQVEDALAALLSDLGIDAQPVVLLSRGTTADPIIGLRVAGVPCLFPAQAVGHAFAYVTGTAQQPSPAELPERLSELNGQQVAGLIALVCRAAVSAQPELLAGPEMADPARAALRLGISLARLAAVPAETATDAERLIAALAPHSITVHVEPGLLRDLTAADAVAEMFQFLRDGLLAELGLPLPPVRLRPDPSLRPGGFAVRINAVRLPPRIALAPGTILVHDTADALTERGIDALPTRNPATGVPGALVAAEHEQSLDQQGYTTWNRLGYFILSLAQDIREHLYQVMTSDVAAALMRRSATDWPVLEEAATRVAPPEVLAPVLRDLLASQVSIRNLRRILETLVRLETETSPSAGTAPDRVTAVRTSLADAIAAKVSRQTRTVTVYLLDKDATRAVAALDGAGDPTEQNATAVRIAAAVRTEIEQLQSTVWVPAVLTTDENRAPLARALRPEFPRLTILGNGDLPPDWNVQPVARLSLG